MKGRSLTVSTSHQTDEEQDKVLVQVQLTASSLANELMNVISRLHTRNTSSNRKKFIIPKKLSYCSYKSSITNKVFILVRLNVFRAL